jgi:uncharacterized protein YkwD
MARLFYHLPQPPIWLLSLLVAPVLFATPQPLAAQDQVTIRAPQAPSGPVQELASAAQERGGPHVNPKDPVEAINFYNAYYVAPADLNVEWNGDVDSCNPGATGQRFREAVLQRINYFRAMAGVPADIVFSDEYNRKAQAAALMMSANRNLDHDPPENWRCYSSDGAEGAHWSNLFLVRSPDAIDGYMQDPGDGNAVVPHRRWLLFPQTMQMGSGDVPAIGGHPAANALYVVDAAHYWDERPATRDGFVAWPPPGFVPEHLIFDRWSIAYSDADFGQAQVTMTLNGHALAVQVLSDGRGFGEAAIIWQPDIAVVASSLAAPATNNDFAVSITNVRIDGRVQDFSYTITAFEPPLYDNLPPQVYIPIVTK